MPASSHSRRGSCRVPRHRMSCRRRWRRKTYYNNNNNDMCTHYALMCAVDCVYTYALIRVDNLIAHIPTSVRPLIDRRFSWLFPFFLSRRFVSCESYVQFMCVYTQPSQTRENTTTHKQVLD